MEDALSILKKYWHHSQFRPLQQDIITSALKGQDTLALLPTGGGKSICFQVPGLIREGLCLVISPLIALMKDQVENLVKKGIQAVAIHTGMKRDEVDLHLNNCIYGQIKFLYVSPERLQTEIFRERIKQMKIGLIAVDEAHCISQWGYDFRPPYLMIGTFREQMPEVPVLALTATATPQVRDDIIDKLSFKKPFEIYQRTFARDNLSFVIRKSENKERKLMEVVRKTKESVIIYARSRRSTEEVSNWLVKQGVSATYYHAGLPHSQREKHQLAWIKNEKRVMAATNAFGMGIDKPDVRAVVHLDLPENLEAYYQEAGRAGRDGVHSYAVVVFNDNDVKSLEKKVLQSQPSIEYLKRVYQCLSNFYQLALGSAQGESFDFDIQVFAERFNLKVNEVYPALKKLEEEGLILFNESFYRPSQLHFAVDKARLYEFQIAHADYDALIKMVLRLYGGGLMNDYVNIAESSIAKSIKWNEDDVVKMLKHLNELQIASYQPMKDKPQVTFVLPRQDTDRLPLDIKRLEARKKLIESKMRAMIEFVTSTHRCRMQIVQDYFGEESFQTCGKCDVCVSRKKKENQTEIQSIRDEVLKFLGEKQYSVEQLEELINPADSEIFIDIVRDLVDEGIIEYDEVWRLKKR